MHVLERSPVALAGDGPSDRLADHFAPCFTLILKLRDATEFGDADALRERVRDMLDRARRDAVDAGFTTKDVRRAAYAVVALLDETVQGSDWSQKAQWLARPMQLQMYERYDAGEEFFTRLERLRANPDDHVDVLEVYYLSLALGFHGRYQLQEPQQRQILIENVCAELKRADRADAGPLSPQGTPHDQAASKMRSRLPAWAVAAFTVVAALVIYLGMSLYISKTADETSARITSPPTELRAAPDGAPPDGATRPGDARPAGSSTPDQTPSSQATADRGAQ